MSEFVIISDTSCDLNQALRERFGVADYSPGTLTYPDGHTVYSNLEWSDMTPEEFYGSMTDKKHLYKTSLPNSAEVTEVFEKYLKQGKDILSINLSSGLSGTVDSCRMAAADLAEKFPDRKLRVVDSLKYSGGVALLCVLASQYRAAGKSLDETADALERDRFHIHGVGPLDDLFFCSRMGRVSNATAVMGTLVGVKPMADFNRTGQSQVLGKARGIKRALGVTVEYMRRTITDPQEQTIFVINSNRAKEAAELTRLIEETFAPKEIVNLSICPSCGATIGPGLTAAFYYGVELTENLEREAGILNEIIAG